MAGFLNRIAGAMGLAGASEVVKSPYKSGGSPGYSVYGGYLTDPLEQNRELVGQQRYLKASDILANISIVAAGTRYFLNLLAKPDWSFEPADKSDEAKKIAEFYEEIITDIPISWTRIVRRAGPFKYHGFGIQEWTAKKRDDGRIGIASIEQRPQHTIIQWDIDDGGEILGVVQRGPQNGMAIYLPRAKIIHMVDDMLTDSPEGMGWFRHLVDPSTRMTEYLRLEKAGFQKDLSGIPVGRAPLSEMNAMIGQPKSNGDGVYTEAEIRRMVRPMQELLEMKAKENSTSLILDSQTFVDEGADGTKTSSVLKWGMDLLQGSAESIPHMGEAITRLTEDMARIIGVENMLTGSKGVGSNALSVDKSHQMFLNVESTVSDIKETYQTDLFARVAAMNGIPKELIPIAKTESVEFKDVEQLAAVLRDMASAGAVLDPDDPAIDDMRDLMGLSRQPEMTSDRMAMMAMSSANPQAAQNQNAPLDENGLPVTE